jgi:hypothetical protein
MMMARKTVKPDVILGPQFERVAMQGSAEFLEKNLNPAEDIYSDAAQSDPEPVEDINPSSGLWGDTWSYKSNVLVQMDERGMINVITPPESIVSMVLRDGRLIVATTQGLYHEEANGAFKEVPFFTVLVKK